MKLLHLLLQLSTTSTVAVAFDPAAFLFGIMNKVQPESDAASSPEQQPHHPTWPHSHVTMVHGDLDLSAKSAPAITLPHLTSVTGCLTVAHAANLLSLNLPKLVSVGSNASSTRYASSPSPRPHARL